MSPFCSDISAGPPVCLYEGLQYLDQERFHPPSMMQAYHRGNSTQNPFCTECYCNVSLQKRRLSWPIPTLTNDWSNILIVWWLAPLLHTEWWSTVHRYLQQVPTSSVWWIRCRSTRWTVLQRMPSYKWDNILILCVLTAVAMELCTIDMFTNVFLIQLSKPFMHDYEFLL